MRLVYSLTFLTIFLLGAYIGVRSFFRSKAIFWGTDRRVSSAIFNAALFGLSWALMPFGGMYFLASIGDNTYKLDILSLVKNFAFFLIFGFVMFLASLWRYFMVSIGRDQLLKTLLGKKDDKGGPMQ